MSSAAKRIVLACFWAGALSAVGCAGSPTSPSASMAASSLAIASTPRNGDLHVTKDCAGTYNFQAGDFCTIKSSNVAEIEARSKIIYAAAANLATLTLDSDVVLDPPEPGNNLAFGHCRVDLATGLGRCTFSGGTGKFTHFKASVNVAPLGGLSFAWEGTYSFVPRD